MIKLTGKKYYIYDKRSKVIAYITSDKEAAERRLKTIKRAFPDEEWVMIEEA